MSSEGLQRFTLARPRALKVPPGAIASAVLLLTLSMAIAKFVTLDIGAIAVAALLIGAITGVASLVILASRRQPDTELTLGADGLLIQRGRHVEFISLLRIEAVNLDEHKVALLLSDRTQRIWPVVPSAPGAPPAGMAAFTAIQAALARYQEHKLAPSPPALLALQSAPLASPDELTPLTLAADYRGGTTADELWLVIENPRVEPFLRGLAAALLPSPHDEHAAAALVAMAESTTHPALKQVLLAASSGKAPEHLQLLQQMRSTARVQS